MTYFLGMVALVIGQIFRRYGLISLIALIVISAAVGIISHLSGGSFWLAAKYTAEVLAALGVIATICTLVSVFTKWG